jgi:hypothetical protein
VRITLRADSGFAREALMSWCEQHRVDYVFGLARNSRLVTEIATDLAWAEDEAEREDRPARRFADFRWTTLDSWSKRRRVIAKAEWMPGRGEAGANPRFVVTSSKAVEVDARTLYEDVYCARGEMENRIKECQLDLFADRTSAATMRANQLRLWFASMAYVLLAALRRVGLAHTELENATCGPPDAKRVRLCRKPAPAPRGRWPPEAPEDRCPGHEKCPPHQDRHGLGLPQRRRLPSGARQALSPSARASVAAPNVPSKAPKRTDPRPWRRQPTKPLQLLHQRRDNGRHPARPLMLVRNAG